MAFKRAINPSLVIDQLLAKTPNTHYTRVRNQASRKPLHRPISNSPHLKISHNPKSNTRPVVTVTIDHLNSNSTKGNALELATRIVAKGIPVTVFVQCSGGIGKCSKNDIAMIRKLHALNKPGQKLVELGIHTLEAIPNKVEMNKRKTLAKKRRTKLLSQKERQVLNNKNLRNVINDITGSYPRVASYHGTGINPNIIPTAEGITFIRGTGTANNGPKNTPRNNNDSFGIYQMLLAIGTWVAQVLSFFTQMNMHR